MLIGHQLIWNFLIQSVAKNRLAHAYLFAGPSQIGKKKLALEFVKWLLCQKKTDGLPCNSCKSCQNIDKNQHPDVFFLSQRQEEKKGVLKTFEIGIDEVKALQHQLSLFPYSANYKIAVVEEVAALTREAANSFLKTLEEPGKNALIILLSSAWQSVLPTIISRCQLIKFRPVPEREILAGLKKLNKKEADVLRAVKLSANRPGLAIRFLSEPEILKDQQQNIEVFRKMLKSGLLWRWELAQQLSQNSAVAQETLSQWLLWLRDRLLENCGCDGLLVGEKTAGVKYQSRNILNSIREIQKTQNILTNPSFNSRLALEILMLKI